MKKILLSIIAIVAAHSSFAQWQSINQLSDLNTWSALPGYIGWYNTSSNAPNGTTYGAGMQIVLAQDTRYGAQIVIPTFDDQIYYRSTRAGTWDTWFNVWSSANLDPDTYLDRSVASIMSAGTANFFSNGYTFAYASSGTPWNGSLISYGGFGGSYDTQINSDYGPNGGKHISFRTMNGDAHTWNNWYEIYHSGNFNRSDVDFTAQTVNCTNVYSNGNIWAKEIRVALINPWADYVFKPTYKLPLLTDIKRYITKNQHLPDMPSAQEVEKNGINLGDVVRIQTKKIEELTLYVIEQQKQIELLKEKQENSKQQNQRIAALETALSKLTANK
jgi:hypothetical protein